MDARYEAMSYRQAPRKALYFQRVYLDGARVEFCVGNWQGDPDQSVVSTGPDGTRRAWDRRQDGDLLVFTSPADWDGVTGFLWRYDPRLQVGEKMPPDQAERAALNNRMSVAL